MERAMSLTETLFGRPPPPEVWQDCEVRFDLAPGELACRRGEEVLDFLEGVEDTKGNNGELGDLTVTNLRIAWVHGRRSRTNISIGLDCLGQITTRPATSRLRGEATALTLMARHGPQRYEFVFTAPAGPGPACGASSGSGGGGGGFGPELLAVVQGVSQAYEASRLYREFKLRGALVANGELRLLPGEQAYSRISGVTNLGSSECSGAGVGVLFITGFRLVWNSAAAEAFNVSIPYLQIRSLRVCDSKQGPCLVVETAARAGGYVLGFKVEPRETLEYVLKETTSLWQAYTQAPVFGVQYDAADIRGATASSQQQATAAAAAARAEEDVPILEDAAAPLTDTWAAACYCAGGYGGDGGEARAPVFSAELGLAIEAPRDPAVTVRQLWCVM